MKKLSVTLVLSAFVAAACAPADDEMVIETEQASANGAFEVWAVDQSNNTGLTYGGHIHVYRGSDLMGSNASTAVPTDIIDLGGATSALCLASTGANPVRPHMVFFNKWETHAVLAFVASGHVVIFDAPTRTPLACFRMSVGAGGARQAHAAFPSADGTYIVVANQNGKILERINTSWATNTFTHDTSASLDLANCVTPNGVPCQLAGVRPDNAPICPVLDSTSQLAYVTLRGGGMFVVNPRTTPMTIIAEYDSTTVHGNGCGGVQANGGMWIDSGGATAANLYQFDVYRFPLSGFSASNPPNTPAPALIFTDPADRDAHGMVATKKDRYVWAFDRNTNVAEVFDATSNTRINTVSFSTPDSADPTPDLGVMAPNGSHMFASLRGPNPLSGDPHVSTGATPGVGVVKVTSAGADGVVRAVVPISNIDAGGVERADVHGIAVRGI